MNRNAIIEAMRAKVADCSRSVNRDFENYDRERVENAESADFPMVWAVTESTTLLESLKGIHNRFFRNEALRFDYIKHGNEALSWCFNYPDVESYFIITEVGVADSTKEEAEALLADTVAKTVEEWVELFGALPKNHPLPIRFRNITLTELKALIHDCTEHGNDSLLSILKRLKQWRRYSSDDEIVVAYDPNFREFSFGHYSRGEWKLNGGIIFHGWPETGYLENGAVMMTPEYGWHLHT